MKKIFLGLYYALIFLAFRANLFSLYFYDDFSSHNPNLIFSLWYSRDKGVWTNAVNVRQGLDNSAVQNGELKFECMYLGPNYSEVAYSFMAYYTNIRFNASKNTPFGYEITRTYAYMDYDHPGHDPSATGKNSQFIYFLAKYNPAVTNGGEGAKFPDFVTFIEYFRPQLDYEPQTQPFSFFTLYESPSRSVAFNLSSLQKPDDSGTVNLVNLLEWCYDNEWWNGSSEVPNQYYINTNRVTFRVTTDGERAYFYVNPNPDNSPKMLRNGTIVNNIPNEFYLIGSAPVTFSEEVVALLGIGNNRYDGPWRLVRYDDYRVRTIASNVVAEISPQLVRAGSIVHLHGVIRATFSTADEAGIGEIYIRLPGDNVWDSTMINNFTLKWIDNNGNVTHTFNKVNGDVNPNQGSIALSVKDGGKTLKIRFNATSDSVYDVFHPNKFGGVSQANSRAIYFIVSNFTTSSNADASGKEVEIFVNNEKYATTGWSRISTTGRAKAISGNAFNMLVLGLEDFNSLTFKTCYDPVGLAGLRGGNVLQKNKIYEGDSGVFFHYDFSTMNATKDNSPISKVEITIPEGFQIDATSIYSDKIGTNFVYYTNDIGVKKIVVNYGAYGTFLPPVSGGDTLHFKVTGTPELSGTNEKTFYWEAKCFSYAVSGLLPTVMGTNELYPIQTILVRKKPPIGETYVMEKFYRNTYYSNRIDIVVKNMGAQGNRIAEVRISIDPIFTNIINVNTSIPSVRSFVTENGTNFLVINYSASNTNIPNSWNDVISFYAFANIIPLTNKNIDVTFKVEADNRNGDGWMPLVEGTDGLKITYFTPFAEVSGYVSSPGNESGSFPPPYDHVIYTDVEEPTMVFLKVRNDGEERNVISRLKIEFSPLITNVINAVSDFKGASVSNYKIGQTNYLEFLYTNVTFNPGEEDQLRFLIFDNISEATNISLKLFAKNTTNYKEGKDWIPDNLTLNFIYPKAKAKAFVEVPGGYIDTSTNQYNIFVIVTNEGRTGNLIKKVKLSFDTTVFSNVVFVNSERGGMPESYNNGILEINYNNSFTGKVRDRIELKVFDKIDTGKKITSIAVSISNQREMLSVMPPEGETLNVEIIPPPTLYAYRISPNVTFNRINQNTNTNTLILVVSNRGWGNNFIEKVKVNIPSFLSGKVTKVSNQLLGIVNGQTGLKISNNNTIWLEYNLRSQKLLPDQIDRLFIDVNVDFTNITNTLWIVEAANNYTNDDGSYNFTNNGKMIPGGTNTVYYVEIPTANTTNTNIITTTVSNFFTFFVFNGSDAGKGVPVKKLRLGFVTPFTNIINVVSGGVNNSIYKTGNTNFVEVDYGDTGLIPGANDTISLWAYDNWNSGETVSSILYEVDYNDGYGFRKAKQDLNIKFENPKAMVVGYITPNDVSHDFEYYNYSLFMKNIGIAGNDIVRLIVEAPPYITNVVNISSTRGAYCRWQNGKVEIFYTNVGNIPSLGEDTISFIAFDNVNYPDEVYTNWKVRADNTLDGSGLNDVGLYGTGSFALNIKSPGYQSFAYIEASNSISPLEKNKIWTSVETNVLYFYVNNLGTSGNYLEKLRIKIPDIGTIINTNGINVTNIQSNSTISVSNGYIWLTYSTPLRYNEGDTIKITVRDLVKYYETNVVWLAEGVYNTSDGKFRPLSVRSGGSVAIQYVAPMPLGNFSFSPQEIYYTLSYFTNVITLSNAGTGTSDWDMVEIVIPEELSKNFNSSLVKAVDSTNIIFDSDTGSLKIYYSNFVAGSKKTIELPLSNSAISNSLLEFDVYARNYVNITNLTGNKQFLLSTIPQYYVTPNLIDTALETNEIRLEVLNNINGNASIKKVEVELPEVVSQIISLDSVILSSEATSVNINLPKITIDYTKENKEISKSIVKDIVTIKFRDNFEMGNITNSIKVKGDAGQGYVELNVKEGQTNVLYFEMPRVYSISKIFPSEIYVDSITNNLELEITNTGYGSDKITYAKFDVPNGLEVRDISSSYGGDISITNGTVYIDYTRNYLSPLQKDRISFTGINEIREKTNFVFKVKVANLTNDVVWYESRNNEGDDPYIEVKLPPSVAYANFIGEDKLYIIETNNVLTYRIKNMDPYGKAISNVSINLSTNTNIFNKFEITSAKGADIEVLGGTNIVIRYLNDKVLKNFEEFDDINFNVVYSFSNNFAIVFDTIVTFYNRDESTNVKAQEFSGGSILYITNGNWGIVEGKVFPYVDGVGVRLYSSGSSVVSTNINGENLITSTATGNYKLTRIPAGNYRLEFSKEGVFKTDSTNIYVEGDKILILPDFRLRNAPLSAGASTIQSVICYDDMESYVEFPTSSLMEDFSLDIMKLAFTDEQKKNMMDNKLIKKPSNGDNMYGYKLNLYNLKDVSIDGATLNLDAILYLKYDKAEIEGRGWKEDDLAIYYWDRIGNNSRWVKIGGVVDKGRKYVSAKVGYIHGFYAVMGKDGEGSGAIRNVALRPKVFTPVDKDGYFGSIRLTFEFDKEYDKYEVRIYDLKGNLVKKFERSGAYVQGEISWDGKDSEGYPVKTGVYIYQIIAGNEKYSGTIIIAK